MTARRLLVVDTETTGLSIEEGERVIEIACVEIQDLATINTRFHESLNPEKEIDLKAVRVHGMILTDLEDKPKFERVMARFIETIRDADVVMHNAEFDRKFLDNELELAGSEVRLSDLCNIIDSLAIAREKFGLAQNDLNSLCKRFKVDQSNRDIHGALIDAELLARVYIRMVTGEQELFMGDEDAESDDRPRELSTSLLESRTPIVVYATDEELTVHEDYMKQMPRNQD